MRTWNRERKRTRDRLLDYYSYQIPSSPIAPIYPHLNPYIVEIPLGELSQRIGEIANIYGYDGDKDEFWEKLALTNGVHLASLSEFPSEGKEGDLYLDKDTGTLYWYKD